jgi:phosphatidylglycerol:prolipoprotein diacylglycerol transferase
MRQILFHIPLHSLFPALPDVPVYGYGAMLFLAFIFCTWLACRLAARQGVSREPIQDLAIWLFISGIVGARLTFMIQYSDRFDSPWQFFAVWDGGLVFYGSFIGGAIGFLLAYRFQLRKYGIRFWQMADIVAPCAALGLCLGRVGCLLNGCCYGNVACPDCPAVTFPMSAAPRFVLTERGYQTAAGFTLDARALDGRTVGKVEPDSPAARAGLREGDVITQVRVAGEAHDVHDYHDLYEILVKHWPRGVNSLSLVVQRPGQGSHGIGFAEETLPEFAPRSLGLHPTQVYESISMALLLFLLLAYLPFRRRDGELMALFMICYAVHRFLNEILRNDTDAFADGLTLSQNLSVLIFVAGVGVWLWLRRGKPAAPGSDTTPTEAGQRTRPLEPSVNLGSVE